MEKIPKYICFILALIGFLTIQAQDVSTQSVNSLDPKISAEQRNSGPAISNNPAKPTTPLSDPKIIAEEAGNMRETGSAMAKPPIDQPNDPKLEAEAISTFPKEVIPVIITKSKVTGTTTKESNNQPAGTIPESNINYRKIKGPDTQPAGTKTAKVTDFRKLNGPNSQPAGEKPTR